MQNNELYHYGVPGMRWGHRKASGKSPVYVKNKRKIADARKTIKDAKKAIADDKRKQKESIPREEKQKQKTSKRLKIAGITATATVGTLAATPFLAKAAWKHSAIPPMSAGLALLGAGATVATLAGTSAVSLGGAAVSSMGLKSKTKTNKSN